MKWLIIALASILLYGAASPVEWKVFSFATDDGDSILLFYDGNSIKRTQDGHVTVRVKSMDATRLVAAEISKEGQARIDAKVKSGYIPPITTLTPSTSTLGGVISEEQANNAGVPVINQVLWEIDCTKSTDRVLSAPETGKPAQASYEAVGDWEHVPPGSVSDNLMRLLCV